jgi:Tfp pilus assembly protein PilN
MMKINLLGQDAPELKVSAGPSAPARQILVFIVSLVVTMSTVGFVYYYWAHQVRQQQAALVREQIRQKELATVKAQNQEYQRQLKTLEERIQTIQKLQAKRQGPVDLMEGLGKTVDLTQDLYLLQVTPKGNRLHILGEAQKVRAIARFINAMMNSPRFGDIKLRQYYQDNQHGRTNFKFNLDCSYIQPEMASVAPGGKSAFAAQPQQNGR